MVSCMIRLGLPELEGDGMGSTYRRSVPFPSRPQASEEPECHDHSPEEDEECPDHSPEEEEEEASSFEA